MRALYGYYRSSASFRVRIALALKGLDYDYKAINLVPDISEHKSKEYLAVNPQGRVPFLVDGEFQIAQSPAILEYLEEAYSEVSLLPDTIAERVKVRQFASLIACDIHPLNNTSVLGYLKNKAGQDADAVNSWYSHWIKEGFKVLETYARDEGSREFFISDRPTLADVYLVPQIWNARRFNVALDDFPTLLSIDAHCRSLDAFKASAPENQPDAPQE